MEISLFTFVGEVLTLFKILALCDYTSVCEGVMHWTNLLFVFVCLAAKASGDLCCRGCQTVTRELVTLAYFSAC